ncbi:MAG: hypothetical protein P8Q97_12260 [Myxococcota bacterium]|nr:hypothetical protein [Myxococcota bacterium]
MKPFSRLTSTLAVVLAITGLVVAGPAVAAEESESDTSSAGEVVDKTFDALVLRPLDGAALVCGGVLMIPAALFGSVGGKESVADAWDLLVLTTWESLVDRPLGRWGS